MSFGSKTFWKQTIGAPCPLEFGSCDVLAPPASWKSSEKFDPGGASRPRFCAFKDSARMGAYSGFETTQEKNMSSTHQSQEAVNQRIQGMLERDRAKQERWQ